MPYTELQEQVLAPLIKFIEYVREEKEAIVELSPSAYNRLRSAFWSSPSDIELNTGKPVDAECFSVVRSGHTIHFKKRT